MRVAISLLPLALFVIGLRTDAAQPPTILDAYSKARAVIDAAVAAHGGAAALDAVRTIRIVIEGDQFWRHQSRKPAPPYDRERERYELLLDLPNGRAITQSWTTYPGGAHRHTGFITDGKRGFGINYRQRTHTVRTYPPADEQTGHLYYLPQFVLKDLAGAGRTLRWLGRLRLGSGAEVDAVTALVRGSLVTVGFDVETHRLRAILNVGNDLIEGDSAVEVELLDYSVRSGVLLPARRVVRSSHGALRDLRFEVVEPGYVIPVERLSPPGSSVDVTAQATPEPVRIVAPGVWAIGGSSASRAVEFADYVLVVDAPPNSADVLARLSALAPGKPVRYVIPTHHHDDHSGGVAQFARAGAAVVTTPGNRGFMAQVLRAVSQAQVEIIDRDVRVFEDAGRRVENPPSMSLRGSGKRAGR